MNRRKKRILNRCIALLFVALFIALMLLIFTGCDSEPKTEYTYTVQKGDTLYTIAQDFEIKDWRKFAYETCVNNGLEQGGMIFPGQELALCY